MAGESFKTSVNIPGFAGTVLERKGEHNAMAGFSKIQDWMERHQGELDAYAGKWVAVGETGVIAVATTLKELLKAPGVNPKRQAVQKVPTAEELAGFY